MVLLRFDGRLRAFDRRIRLLAVLFVVAGVAFGQFENLSTTSDGEVIYFSTVLRPRGSSDLPYPKVYRLDRDGVRLVSQTAYPLRSVETGGWIVEGDSVSGDGQVVAVNSSAPCHFGTPCEGITQEFSLIQIGRAVKRYKGRAQISRSGRYALLDRKTGLFGFMPDPTDLPRRGVSRLDLASGTITLVGEEPAIAGGWIAADGTILATNSSKEWFLTAPSGQQLSLGPAPTAARAVLADDASFVLYQVGVAQPFVPQAAISEIRIRERNGNDQSVAPSGATPNITADSRFLFLLMPVDGKLQAFLQARGGEPMFQASAEPEGLTEATISGDGRHIVANTATGRLVTISTLTGQSTQIIGPTPKLEPFPIDPGLGEPDPIRDPLASGSTYSIRGEHLTLQDAAPETPLPFSFDGVRVLVSGQPAALYRITASEILYQVAWETPIHEPPINFRLEPPAEVVLESGDPGWEAVVAISGVSAFYPRAIALGSDSVPFLPGVEITRPVYAIHGDWHGLVTQKDPARPGEYVSAYVTGLGPVNPQMPTGWPGPSEPPARIARECVWSAYSSGNHGDWTPRAEVAFAGTAPTLVGIYQVTLKIPDDTPSGFYSLSCGPGPDSGPSPSSWSVVELINVQRP